MRKAETLVRDIQEILDRGWGNDEQKLASIQAILVEERDAQADAAGMIRFTTYADAAKKEPTERRGFDVDGLGIFALTPPSRGTRKGYRVYHIPSGYELPSGGRCREQALEVARTAIKYGEPKGIRKPIVAAPDVFPNNFILWTRELHHGRGEFTPYETWLEARHERR